MWSYLWREWYCEDRWILWTRSACNILSILKTTMFIEGHWKALKRQDFLYKFFHLCLDLLTYIILEKLIPLQQRKFQQILSGRETLEWQKSIKAEWKKLLLRKTDNLNDYNTNIKNLACGCPYFLTNRFIICKHLVNLKGSVDAQTFESIKRNNTFPFLPFNHSLNIVSQENVILSAHNNINIKTDIFEELIGTTKRALEILEEQQTFQNISWANGVKRNFSAIKL